MRNFLKQNSIMILCALFVAVLAEGSTIVRPYGSSDYAGGAKAVGAKVNAEFENIATWLNGGNIGPTNISTSGVATSNIASFAVTLAKLDTASIKVTSASTAYYTQSEVPAVVTNLSTTFTSTGRPVRVSLEPSTTTYIGALGATFNDNYVSGGNVVSGDANDAIFFVRDTTTTALYKLQPISLGGGAWRTVRHPCSAFSYTEPTLAAGTYTFALKASAGVSGSVSIVSIVNCRLVVREW